LKGHLRGGQYKIAIILSKKIPKESFYYSDIDGGGSGLTTNPVEITLFGSSKMTFNTKKKLIKIKKKQAPKSWVSNVNDDFDVEIMDLKDGEDDFVIQAYLSDDSNDTAWEKYWKLRAMCSVGGPLHKLTIENITFESSKAEVYLSNISGIIKPDDTGPININSNDDSLSRIEVVLTFYVGDER